MKRVDPRIEQRIRGPAWNRMRAVIHRINCAMLNTSPTVVARLTTIYVKYGEPDGQPFAVLWLRKASELTLGMAIPDKIPPGLSAVAPKGCVYKGLTAYLSITPESGVPIATEEWAQQAAVAVKSQGIPNEGS